MALLLLQANATVTVCHSATPDLAQHTRQADIVVAAFPGVDAGSMKGVKVVFIGDAADDLAAKTAQGIADWRPEWCLGQLRLPGCKADLKLPDVSIKDAAAKGAKTMIIGVANAGGFMAPATVADVIAAGRFVATLGSMSYVRRRSSATPVGTRRRRRMVTLLAIEREPKLFKAAVDIVGLTDFVAYMSYKPDYRCKEVAETNPSFGGKLPNENLPAYMNVSPINFVEKIEAPLLVIATTGDKIVPYSLHTGRLLDSLKAKNKVHEAKIYEDAPEKKFGLVLNPMNRQAPFMPKPGDRVVVLAEEDG